MRSINKGKYRKYTIKISAVILCLATIALAGCSDSDITKTLAKKIKETQQQENGKDDEINDFASADSVKHVTGDKGEILQDEFPEDSAPGIKHADDFNDESASEHEEPVHERRGDIKVYSTEGDLIEPEISVVEVEDGTGFYEENVNKLQKASDFSLHAEEHNDCYAYNRLNNSERVAYLEIYNILNLMKDDVLLSSKDTEEIDHAFKCVMVDHPEIFYVKGYSVGKYMVGTLIDCVSFTGTYTLSRDEVANKRDEIENYITKVIDKAPEGDEYDKIKYVYEYLIDNNEYDINAPDNQNILSVVENGRTVCQGYAKMTQLILNRMGIFCTLVNGSSKGGSRDSSDRFSTDSNGYQAHVWNIVKCNGRYYNIDTTWGDSAFTLIDNETGEMPTIDINYEYCLVDDSALLDTHKPNPVVTMPMCNSVNDNYYVREGLFFTEVSDNKVRAAFEKAYANGTKIVSFKCADSYVYNDLFEYLIDSQKIFDFIDSDNIKFVEYAERNMLLFSI